MFAGLSCADYSWPKLDHGAALRLIRDLGMDAVDIGLFQGSTHIWPRNVADDPARWGGIIGERTAACGLRVADVFLQVGQGLEACAPNNPDRRVRREQIAMVSRVAQFAAAIGAPGMTVLPGIPFGGARPEAAIEQAAIHLTAWIDVVGEAGLALSVEPHQMSCVDTPARTLQLLARAPRLGVTLDPGHFVYGGCTTAEMVSLLDRTRHIQLRAAAPGVMQARLADNTIDFAALLEGLSKRGYDGYVAIEYTHNDWLECDRVDNVSETAELRDLVRSVLGERLGGWRPGSGKPA